MIGTVIAYLYPRLRQIEVELPDAMPDKKDTVAEPATPQQHTPTQEPVQA